MLWKQRGKIGAFIYSCKKENTDGSPRAVAWSEATSILITSMMTDPLGDLNEC